MGRVNALIAASKAETEIAVEAEVEKLDYRPDNIDAETWALIQETGREATQRLYEIIVSPKFPRLRASDQAKLIALAQNRAYGLPQTNRFDANKRRGQSTDVTASELRDLQSRAALPEYRHTAMNVEINDAEEF